MSSFINRQSYQSAAFSFGQNSAFDINVIILGGLPLYLPFALLLGEHNLSYQIPFDWIFWGNQLVSMPHVFASYGRLHRKIKEKKVNSFFGVPCFLAILITLIIATINGYFLQVMTAVNVWQSYHYLRQGWGISRLISTSPDATRLEEILTYWAYHAAMPLFIIGRWNMLYIFWHGKPSTAIIPVQFPELLINGLWALGVGAFGIGIYCEWLRFRRAYRQSTTYDLSGLIMLTTYFGIHWYGFLSLQNYYTGFLTITVFHAVQYLGISWKFELKQSSSESAVTMLLRKLPTRYSFLMFCIFLYAFGDVFENHVFSIGNIFWKQFGATCLSAITAQHYLLDTLVWRKNSGL